MNQLPSFLALAAALLVAALLSLSATQASAQSDVQTRADQSPGEQARHHFDEGARFFYEGDFAAAVVEFRKAYQFQPDPMILYNLSLAHSRLGNIGDAYDAGRTASTMPGMPDAARVRNDARIVALSLAISAGGLSKRMQTRASASQKPKTDHFDDTERFTDFTPSPLGWAGIGTAAVGAGLLTYALVLNQGLGSDIDQYRSAQQAGRTQEYYEVREHIESQTGRAKIVLYSGLGLTAAGLGIWLYDILDRDTSAPYNLTVNLAPFAKTGMLQVTTRF